MKTLRENNQNGVYYFLGNFYQHIQHVMPLYKIIGGTVIVISQKAKNEVEKYGVKCICIDDEPDMWLDIDTKIIKTIEFLNENAKAVMIFDAFYWQGVLIEAPTLWLAHGVGTKGAVWDKQRFAELNKLTKISSLGEDTLRNFMGQIDAKRLVKLNPVRCDEVCMVSQKTKDDIETIRKKLGIDAISNHQKIVAYMPTYWGPTSVMDTGIEIAKNIPDDTILLLWPHPQTPDEIIAKYRSAAKNKKNIILAQNIHDVAIMDIYTVADKFISDHTTSVITDLMLTGKPIIFAFGSGEYRDTTIEASPLRLLVHHSPQILYDNIADISKILEEKPRLLAKFFNRLLIYRIIWWPNGGAAARTVKVVEDMIGSKI